MRPQDIPTFAPGGTARYTSPMSRESLVLFFGVIVTVVSYIGVPSAWKERIIIGSGVVLMLLGYSLRRAAFFRSIEVAPGERRAEAFVEHDVPKMSETRVSL